MEEARAIALQAAAEQREKLLARAREAEAAKAAAEAAAAAPPPSGVPPAITPPASGALATAGTPEVCLIPLMKALMIGFSGLTLDPKPCKI